MPPHPESHPEHEKVRRILGPLGEAGDLLIDPIGSGAQGNAFTVQRADGLAIAGEMCVVVKLYQADEPDSPDAAARQHRVMRLLHQHVDGRSANGWTLRAPRPLLLCDDPPALVTALAPGRPMGQVLQESRMHDAAEIRSAAQAMLLGLDLFWSRCGRLYGDLSMNNVLCDPTKRTLAFIDSGVQEAEPWSADLVSRNWHPASRDLGYQLLNGAASLKLYLPRLRRWRWRMRMSEELILGFRDRLPDERTREQFLDEVRRCSDVHLHQIETSASPSGLWRRLVRYIATIWIDHVLARCMEPTTDQAEEEHNRVTRGKPVARLQTLRQVYRRLMSKGDDKGQSNEAVER